MNNNQDSNTNMERNINPLAHDNTTPPSPGPTNPLAHRKTNITNNINPLPFTHASPHPSPLQIGTNTTKNNKFTNVPTIPSLPHTGHPSQATTPGTTASHSALETQQHLEPQQHPTTLENLSNSLSNTHSNLNHSSKHFGNSGSLIIAGTPELTHKAIGTKEYIIQHGIMDNIYSDAL